MGLLCTCLLDSLSSTQLSQSHHKPSASTYKAAGKSNAPQPRADVIPHSYTAPADPLANSQLQKEERDADEDEQYEIWNQIGTWQERKRSVEMPVFDHTGPSMRR